MNKEHELFFSIKCFVSEEYVDELGEKLATFLYESFINGEDVIEIEYIGHEKAY